MTLTDEQYEKRVRQFGTANVETAALLRLLDAERAELSEVRAQLAATEAKIARVESARRYKVDGETWVCDAADVDRALRSSVGARLKEEA